MNRILFLPRIICLWAALLCVLMCEHARAEESPIVNAKIRLMAEALAARDAGDLELARSRAEELLVLLPGDANVQRLIRELEVRKAEREKATKAAEDELIEVEIPDTEPQSHNRASPAPTEAPPSSEEEKQQVLQAEAKRVEALLKQLPEERRTIRHLTNQGRYNEALAALDAIIAALPEREITKAALVILREERLAVEKLKAKGSKRPQRTSAAPGVTDGNPQNGAGVNPPINVAAELAIAQSQYEARDFDAAQKAFRRIEAFDPYNQDAKQFLTRIAEERVRSGELNRDKTRVELIQDVTNSWQRAAAYPAPPRRRENAQPGAALGAKLDEIILPSVSFTRTEIRQVVAALSAISAEYDPSESPDKGVNIVLLDPTQKSATVTLTLRNASLKRVLDFVAESVGYQYEIQADAVVLRPGGETSVLATDFFAVNRATVMRMTGHSTIAGKADSRLSSVGGEREGALANGREGTAIQSFLQQAGVNFDTVPGASLAYDGSALIVTQTPRNIERIRNILTRYHDVRQVEIEAKFMEVQEGALEELGVNWTVSRKATQHSGANARYQTGARSLASAFSHTASNQQGSIVIPGVPAVESTSEVVTASGAVTTTRDVTPGTASVSLPIINNAPQLPGAANLAAAASPLATIAGIVGEFDVNAVVRALSQKQGTDLLSAPRVTVLSGNSATITVAQEMRYPQSFGQSQSQVGTGSASGGGSAGVAITAGTPQEFTARNVGVELKVTPTVEEDDYSISLDLNPKVTEFDGFVEYGGPSIAISNGTTVTVPSGFYQPIFSVRDISTRVTLWDGATLVMGGLTREEVKKVNDKVPILGDIPLIGRMFRSKGESAQKRNLLIFVTAHLVTPGGAPRQIQERTANATAFQNPTVVTPAGTERRGLSALQ